MIFIVLLALIWAVVLFPSLFRAKLESSPIDGVREFEQAMGILAGTRRSKGVSGRWVMVPRDVTLPHRRRKRVIRRRRQAFQRLLAAAGVTLVLGLIPGLRWILVIHVVVDVVLAAYAWQLRQWRNAEVAERRRERAAAGAAAGRPGAPITPQEEEEALRRASGDDG